MGVKNAVKRVVVGLGATGLLSGALLAGTVATASASTIPNGYIQICAQGNYSAYVEVHPAELGGGMTTGGMASTIQRPGNCWMQKLSTHGVDAPVDVWGIRPDGSTFHVGAASYNSKDGLGLGAQGTVSRPTMAKW
ncbi:hypothetical protein [Saccharopolyspora pogona]|uniref:hypothetical protein n=1 Tax=Saccharopolyspora pogona TaxID=333966 RepID=UPI00168646DE|nr:hypothetical protein [Saccharopolyspora pogona]